MLNPKKFWWDVTFMSALAGTMALVLSLPIFPTQDGAVHLYYVDVVRSLLSHANTYGRYFEIRALLTPYSFQYYLTLALETVFSPAMSEKVLVCIYIACFGWSFKYLVESVTEHIGGWSLTAMPFCLHSLVYAGSFNYPFGVTFAVFLSGYWIRWQDQLPIKRIAILACGLILLLLTHPIPVMVFLLLIGLYLAVELLRSWPAPLRGRERKLVVFAGMAVMTTIWIASFLATPRVPSPNPTAGAGMREWIVTAVTELKLWPIAPITSGAFRFSLIATLSVAVAALLVAVVRGWRVVLSPRVAALFVTSLACFFLYVFLPEWINGAAHFRERFPIFFVLLMLAAAAAAAPSVRWSYVPAAVALVATCCTLGLQWQRMSKIAADLRPVLSVEIAKPLAAGVILEERNPPDPDLGFDPYIWAGAHVFRQSHAILLNTPWLDLPFYMLRPAHAGPWDFLDPYPETTYVSSQGARPAPRLDFAVRVGGDVASGRMDSVARTHCLSLANRVGERLAVYTRGAAETGSCDTGSKVMQ